MSQAQPREGTLRIRLAVEGTLHSRYRPPVRALLACLVSGYDVRTDLLRQTVRARALNRRV